MATASASDEDGSTYRVSVPQLPEEEEKEQSIPNTASPQKNTLSKSPSTSSPSPKLDAAKVDNQVEISKWLKSIGLECYIEAFQRENIELHQLAELDDEHLKELGVSLGHRLKLRKAIETLSTGSEDTQVSEYVIKIIVVGDIGTGKTSLIQRYTNGTFDRGYKATIGVDFCLKEIRWNKNTTVSVQLWDIAGQERFANLTRMYYKEAKGAFVVFDVFREKTFEAVLKWKADIDSKVKLPNGKVIPVVLLANKCDLVEKPVNLTEFCKQYGFEKCFLTSAKEDIGINDASNFLIQTILENDDNYLKQKKTTASAEPRDQIVVHNSKDRTNSSSSCCS